MSRGMAGLPRHPLQGMRRALALKIALAAALLVAFAALVSRVDLRRDLKRLNVGFLSGAPEGNYHALVDELARTAAVARGTIRNLSSEGSGDNVRRLEAAARSCEAAFALAQDGSEWGRKKPELIGRLPKSESVFFVGRGADAISDFHAMRKMRIGVGPAGSGSARLARQIFALPEMTGLEVTLSNHPLDEQLQLVDKGQLDLEMLVIDEDAPLLVHSIRDRGLQIAGLLHLDVIARRIPHVRTGRVGAGQYDAVRLLPGADKRVLRLDTLVIGNGCAGRSATLDLMTVLASEFPDFLRHNKETPNKTGLELSAAARSYLDNGGLDTLDTYAPWVAEVMPLANWAYVVMGVSLLFNAMGAGHRFRLWRIDAERVRLESELFALFGPAATLGDLARLAEKGTKDQLNLAAIDIVISELEQLAARSRRYSLSALVPMGQEMAYRYQEGLIQNMLSVLRALR